MNIVALITACTGLVTAIGAVIGLFIHKRNHAA